MPIESNKISRNRIHISDHCVHVGFVAKTPREPCIEVVQDAGGIRAIRVTCRCGEVMCLDLDYSSKAA